MRLVRKNLAVIIAQDKVRRDDAISIVMGDMSSGEFMNKHGLSRDMTAGYIRFYRAQIRKDTLHLSSIGECNWGGLDTQQREEFLDTITKGGGILYELRLFGNRD